MDIRSQDSVLRTSRKVRGGAWWLPVFSAIGVGGLMALAAGTVQVPSSAGAQVVPAMPVPELVVTRLDWLPSGGEVRERLRLLDPTPLFMPGTRAAGFDIASEGPGGRPGGDAGAPIEAELVFPDQRPARDVLRAKTPVTPLEATEAVLAPRWFDGMARTKALPPVSIEGPAALSGSGRMDVYRSGEAVPQASVVLPNDAVLDATGWRPIEMNLLVNSAGVVATPKITSGSGVTEVDDRVRALARQDLLPSLLLRPGSYRLVVGP